MAQNVGRGVFSASTKAAVRVDAMATGYTSRNAATDQPVVLKQTTKNGIETFVRGSAALARVTQTSLGFVAKHVERAGERAAVMSGNGKGPSPRVVDAAQAFQVLADAFEASGEHLVKTVTTSAESVLYNKYGHEATVASTRALTAGTQVVRVVTSARGAPGLLIKSVGKGAIRAHLKDGRDVVLQPGEQENDYLERTAAEDLIVLDDNVTQVTKTDIAMDEPRTGIMSGEPLELDLIDMGDKTVPAVNMRNE